MEALPDFSLLAVALPVAGATPQGLAGAAPLSLRSAPREGAGEEPVSAFQALLPVMLQALDGGQTLPPGGKGLPHRAPPPATAPGGSAPPAADFLTGFAQRGLSENLQPGPWSAASDPGTAGPSSAAPTANTAVGSALPQATGAAALPDLLNNATPLRAPDQPVPRPAELTAPDSRLDLLPLPALPRGPLGGSPSARPGGGNSRLAAALPEAEFAPAAGVRPSQPAAADVLDRLPPPADGQRLPPAAEVARELAVTDAELPGFSDNRPVSSGLAPIAQSPAAGDGAGRVLFGDLPVAPTHPRFGEEVLQRIRIMVDDGIGQARLRLNPPELGALDIRISLTDDRATVHFAASHALARDSLEAGLPRLRELLEAAGISLAEGQVSARQGSAEQQAGGHAAQPPAFAVDFSTPDSDPAPGPYRQLPAGRVDLYA